MDSNPSPPSGFPNSAIGTTGLSVEGGVVLPPEELLILQERLKTIDQAITGEELLERVKRRLKGGASSP